MAGDTISNRAKSGIGRGRKGYVLGSTATLYPGFMMPVPTLTVHDLTTIHSALELKARSARDFANTLTGSRRVQILERARDIERTADKVLTIHVFAARDAADRLEALLTPAQPIEARPREYTVWFARDPRIFDLNNLLLACRVDAKLDGIYQPADQRDWWNRSPPREYFPTTTPRSQS